MTTGYCECGCGEKTPIAKKTRAIYGYRKGEPQRFVKNHHPSGERHTRWSGEKIGYRGLHNWIEHHAEKTKECSFCGRKGWTEWANISGEYRRDVLDFIELCSMCHTQFDIEKAAMK
jgi:hypothetical protein